MAYRKIRFCVVLQEIVPVLQQNKHLSMYKCRQELQELLAQSKTRKRL